jgi:HK97 family phage major capsid protein
MKINEQVKAWLRENKEMASDADDAAYQKAAAEALVDGSLTNEKFVELTKDPDAEKANALNSKLDAVLEAINGNQKGMADFVEKLVQQQETPKVTEKTEEPKMKKVESGVTDATIAAGEPAEDGETKVRHITADKQYSTTKGAKYFPQNDNRGRKHPSAGLQMKEDKRPIDELSELDRAVCGSFAKWAFLGNLVNRGDLPKTTITDHDRELVQYALRNMNWGGELGETKISNRRLNEVEVKQILDESGGSRGLELVPIVFDDAIITTPLLHSEFYPRVNVVTIPRGRRIEGASISNVTLTWNATESTAIVTETTTSFVTAFDTNIMTVTGAIHIGLDFLSDTPVNFGDMVTQEYGQRLLNELDDVIVSGDGSSQPTGINDQGVVVAFGAAWTIGNLVNIMLGVGKEYKQGFDNNRICYGAHPTTYSDCRQIATGVTGDTRLVLGDDINNYMALGHPFLVNDTYGATEMNAVNLARYRMYRRLGLTMTSTTEGQTLGLANQILMIARARFGGQLEDTAACRYTDSGAA